MAAAILPPASIRLEFFGPLGGPRLIVASDGVRATAILPGDRAYDQVDAAPEAMRRMIGLPLDGRGLRGLLAGTSICPGEAGPAVRPDPASPDSPNGCALGDLKYEWSAAFQGGPLATARLSDRAGVSIAGIDYGERPEDGPDPWPRTVRLSLADGVTVITLLLKEGPTADRLDPALFSPAVPADFERQPLFGSASVPALLGPGAGTSP